MSILITDAVEFAIRAHGDQKRKYTGDPYFVHLAQVAGLVSRTHADDEMIAAAYLHDVVEDCGVELYQIIKKFGYRTAFLVEQLTDVSTPEDGNRARRKEIDREHFRNAGDAAQTIKLADLISNTSTIMNHDPGFAKIYMAEKKLLLPLLQQGNPGLLAEATRIVNNYYAEIPHE